MSERLTFVQHEGPEPPSMLEAARLTGNFYDEEGRRVALFGTKHCLLFAAAPELLELLREAIEMGMPYGPSWFGQIGWTERVKAAIAKTEPSAPPATGKGK